MDPSIRDLSIEEKKAQFRKAAITHRLLQQTDRTIMRAIGEPAGFAFLLVHGPTGVGKTKMIEILTERIKGKQPAPPVLPVASWVHQSSVFQIPLLLIEARPTDGTAFNRAYYYRTLLSLLGERTYPQQIQVDIHAETDPPKRRKVTGKAAQFNDLPDLREAAEDAIRRHGVRVIIVDEAHHLMYTGSGGPTVTLQEQLEWLKSMSNTTQALHMLVGTYDVFNFGRFNGQLARRCLPVHFPRYLLQREEDCLEFQAALLALLNKVPLRCDAEMLVGSYWVYFYEGSIGCIGVLKDWLMRAVSTALDEGQDSLSLDCLQDHALPTDICRQMALDAYEGEQKLKYTESNREHLWRLLQGGELIAPVPPLPPRQTPPTPPPVENGTRRKNDHSQPPLSDAAVDTASAPKSKKTRSRKKAEVPPSGQEQGSVIQAEPEAEPSLDTPKRRRKKVQAPVVEDLEQHLNASSKDSGEASSGLVDVEDSASLTKAKRTRRVGEPKPKRYAVGEKTAEHNA